MVRKVWLAVVWAAVVCGSRVMGAQSSSCAATATPADNTAVVQTVRTMFAAATTDDLDKFHSVAAPGFYMYDNGQRFEGDAIMKLIAAQHAKGFQYIWNVTQPDVHVHCGDAWIAYVNDGSVQSPGAAATPVKWLESAVLRREAGVWKVVFFHSTREAK
jgi:hypothetical protein